MRITPLNAQPPAPTLRKPTVRDVPAILALLAPELQSERILPRSARQVTERLRDYTVAVRDSEVVGVASISLVDLHLAEVGVLTGPPAIRPALLDAVLAEVEQMGVGRAFVLTNAAAEFEELGFSPTTLAELPEKRDRQCLRCPRLPHCRQVALERSLDPIELRASA